nr:nucleotide-binding alpha-beta plait domain-containing protein [Tanacetum cinerariifolium]
MASGLKININKSKLMGYDVHSDEVETAARYIGCATFVAIFSHLVVKVGGRMERINSWDDVVSKVTSWLSKWKLKTLSIGGRLTLIKSVLTSIPLYQMSGFKVLIKVLNILESIRRKFSSGIEGNERKLALISWDTVLASKKYDGFGILSFFAMNRALLSKWVWRFLSQISSMWTRTIKAIHGEKGNLEPMEELKRSSKTCFFSRISGVILPNMRDLWIWSFEASGDFSVTSARRLIDDYLLPKEDVQTRWVKVVPIKINVFAWRVRLDKLPTRLNLSLRGVEISSIITKEDDVANIFTSVYITNFPESVSTKELFHACKQYGHVVDSVIHTKRSKNGKRPPNKKEGDGVKKTNVFSSPKEDSKANVNTGGGNSYMGALKGVKQVEVEDLKSGPTLLLGDDCVVSKDFSNALLGRVKEFASLANLKLALGNEGFVDITIKYMGELWVMLEFNSEQTINKFRDNVSVASWFSQIIEAITDFEIEGRIAWVEVEGISFKLWSGNTFSRIATKWGKLLDVDDQDETCFHSKRLCIYMKSGRSIVEEFKIIHRGKIYWIRANETPGWVPDFTDESHDDDQDEINSNDDDTDIHKSGGAGDNSNVEGVPETLFEDEGLVKSHVEGESINKNVDQSEDPFNIYPLLNKNKPMDGSVNKSGSSLKYPPGFTPIDGNGENSTPVEDVMIRNVEEVRTCNREENNDAFSDNRVNSYTKEAGTESLSSVEDTWKGSPCVGSNAMKILIGKLKFHKNHIREWSKTSTVCRKNVKAQYKRELQAVDLIIDSGQGTEKEISTRAGIINTIQRCDMLDSMEMAQKAKVKWAVEGDENSGFFHGMLYKKRSILNIRDVMVDGMWVDSPNKVKKEFLDHFKLESEVTNDEIKKVVCPTEEFQFGKGLKEGDPLSHFLFILIMESLHLSFQRVLARMFHGIKLDGLVNISHMFYADDAIFVGQWSENNISTLVHVLECFHSVSGLKINMSKSKILGVHVDNVKVSRAANIFGCLVLKTPFLYLGSFVGGAMHRLQAWNDIVDRVRRRLSKWKMKMLSIGGRLTLVKSVLGGAEQTQTDELAALMQPVTLTPISDRWTWTLNSSGEFSVASVRNLIDVKIFPKGEHKTRWIRYVPIKVIVVVLERRFCQQRSWFHGLPEFDGKKRRCRKRLANHNARRPEAVKGAHVIKGTDDIDMSNDEN